MKLGFVSALLEEYSFEQMIDLASREGFACVEVACWPAGKAERRYAGVSHIDVDDMSEENIAHIKEYSTSRGVEISALAYYPNVMDPTSGPACAQHLQKVIRASHALGVDMVTTFIGRDQHLTIEENLTKIEAVWQPILELAEELGVKIAIENCPMLFGPDQWPGGQNIMTSPANWEKVFRTLRSPNLGINYDPSHFVWQMMNYCKPIHQFADKIFHVHFKDIKLYPWKLDEVGIMAYPLDYMSPKLPGLGDVDWSQFVCALTDIGYDGYACIEVEDRAFEATNEKREQSLALSKRYIEQFVI